MQTVLIKQKKLRNKAFVSLTVLSPITMTGVKSINVNLFTRQLHIYNMNCAERSSV